MTNPDGRVPWWRRTEILIAAFTAIAGVVALTIGIRRHAPAIATGDEDSVKYRPIANAQFEISGVAHVPGSNQVLVLDDDTTREIFLIEIASDTSQSGEATPIPLGVDVTDMEGITFDGTSYYVVGSQSKPTGFDGVGLIRFSFDPATRRVGNLEAIQDLKAWLAEHVPELKGTARLIGDHVLNIEALAWDPQHERLLLGLRAPVTDGQALVVPIKLVDKAGAFSRDNIRVDGPSIRVDLGGAGIRSLEYDSKTKTFRLITGATLNEETRDFRLVEWDGRDGSPVRDIAVYSRKLKPEGITGAEFYGRPTNVIVFDVGTFTLVD